MNALLEKTATESPSRGAHASGHTIILCADAEPMLHSFYRRVLEDSGHTVHLARNGVEAWKSMQVLEYDLFILDYDLPGMNGLELATRIRGEGMEQPIVFATGEVLPLLQADLSSIRLSAILLKPFSIHELRSTVRRVFLGNRLAGGCLPFHQMHEMHTNAPRNWGLNE